jgi:hypothetical protein
MNNGFSEEDGVESRLQHNDHFVYHSREDPNRKLVGKTMWQ